LPFRSADHAAQDSNHERISVPEVSQFSQQRLTSIGHYESAWRTENTDSNPAGDTSSQVIILVQRFAPGFSTRVQRLRLQKRHAGPVGGQSERIFVVKLAVYRCLLLAPGDGAGCEGNCCCPPWTNAVLTAESSRIPLSSRIMSKGTPSNSIVILELSIG